LGARRHQRRCHAAVVPNRGAVVGARARSLDAATDGTAMSARPYDHAAALHAGVLERGGVAAAIKHIVGARMGAARSGVAAEGRVATAAAEEQCTKTAEYDHRCSHGPTLSRVVRSQNFLSGTRVPAG